MDLRTFGCRDCDYILLYWDRSCDESLVTYPVLQTSGNLLIRWVAKLLWTTDASF